MVRHHACFAGIDWASESHHVCVVSESGAKREERTFRHGGVGLAEMAEWIAARSGCAPGEIPVAIEVPHGPVVESLMDRGFPVYSINPKQLDRFRDRFSPAGAKDDSLDARVLADALRTDGHCFRKIDPVDPVVVELREWSRIAEELTRERTRLSNRVRDQLWRYYPQLLEAADNIAQPWFLELWARVPTPAKARRVHRKTLDNLLKRHRIRRITADRLMELLRSPAIPVAPGTTAAAVAHIRSASERLGLVQRQLTDAKRQIARLIESLASAEESDSGQPASNATLRSSPPCPESARPYSPRCSPRRPNSFRGATTRRCGACAESPPSHGVLENTRSSSAAAPRIHVSVMQSTTGRELRSSTTPSAGPSTPPCAPGVTATPVRCARSPTACSPSLAQCSQPGPATYPVTRHNIMQPDPRTLRGVTGPLSDPLTNGGESSPLDPGWVAKLLSREIGGTIRLVRDSGP